MSKASITSDVQYQRSQAKETIKKYATEYLPEQYQVCLRALDEIIKRAFDILETSDDNREKLQAMELFKDTHLVKLELLLALLPLIAHYTISEASNISSNSKKKVERYRLLPQTKFF